MKNVDCQDITPIYSYLPSNKIPNIANICPSQKINIHFIMSAFVSEILLPSFATSSVIRLSSLEVSSVSLLSNFSSVIAILDSNFSSSNSNTSFLVSSFVSLNSSTNSFNP